MIAPDEQYNWMGAFQADPFGRRREAPAIAGPFGAERTASPLWDNPEQKRDMLMAMASELLQGSGSSPVPQQSSAIFGRALMAANQARQAALQAAEEKKLNAARVAALEREEQRGPFGTISPSDFTPESLAEFQKTGDWAVLKRDPTGGMGRYNPGQYTSDSWAHFLETQDPSVLVRYVTPANPTVQTIAGGQEVVTPSRTGGAPIRTPLSTAEQEQAATAERARQEAEAKARGTVAGEVLGAIQKKGANAKVINQTLDIADPLIDASTGSPTGNVVDKLSGFFGYAPDGAQAIASLKILQAGLILNAPRLEGPQGVLDLKLYEDAAGQIANPNVPRETRKAAVRTIRALQAKYKENAGAGKDDPLGIR